MYRYAGTCLVIVFCGKVYSIKIKTLFWKVPVFEDSLGSVKKKTDIVSMFSLLVFCNDLLNY